MDAFEEQRYKYWCAKFAAQDWSQPPTCVFKVIRFNFTYRIPIYNEYPLNIKDLHAMLKAYGEYNDWLAWTHEDLVWNDNTGQSVVVSTQDLKSAIDGGLLRVEN